LNKGVLKKPDSFVNVEVCRVFNSKEEDVSVVREEIYRHHKAVTKLQKVQNDFSLVPLFVWIKSITLFNQLLRFCRVKAVHCCW